MRRYTTLMQTVLTISMPLTFLLAVGTLMFGMVNMGNPKASGKLATTTMFLRVGFCFLLLVQMLIYAAIR